MDYPYLGRNYVNGKPYVVFFTEEETGLVVMNETDSKDIVFGKIGNFDENAFELLPKGECVRLSNFDLPIN